MKYFATCIFCDEIRTENTGKLVLVGVYNDFLILPSIPFTLPKLSFMVTLRSPVEKPHRSMEIRVEIPAEEDHREPRVKISEAQIIATKKKADPTDPIIETRQYFSIAPFEIKKPGSIKVWVKGDDEEVFGGILNITKAPKTTSAPDIIGLITMMKNYQRVLEFGNSIQGDVAVEVLNRMLSIADPKFLGNLGDLEERRTVLSRNTCRVLFKNPMQSLPKIKIKESHKILNVDRFGFDVRFPKSKTDLPNFEYEIDSE